MVLLLSKLLIILLIQANIVQSILIKTNQIQQQNQKSEDVGDDGSIAFSQKDSVQDLLKGLKGDFTIDLFDNLLTRKDLSHLFLSEITMLTNKLQKEFPDIITVSEIGRTWEGRPITIITLDARDLLKKRGVAPIDLQTPLSTVQQPKKEEGDALSDIELLQRKYEQNNPERLKIKQQNDDFNKISQEERGENIMQQLGIELTQLKSTVGKHMSHRNRKNYIQLAQNDGIFNTEIKSDNEEFEQSISELTKSAKETISNHNQQLQSEASRPVLASANQTLTSSNKQQTTKKEDQEDFGLADKKIDNANQDIKVIMPSDIKGFSKIADDSFAILMTGATHARELLSSQVPLFMCLKLIHQGVLQNNEKYEKMLATSKFHFIPIINVDGANLVEEKWNSEHKILNKRKNMNPEYLSICGEENSGVDLNRNYGTDWAPQRAKNATELCGDFWPGDTPFSEPETRAMRDFVSKNKNELKFIINCHTSGNEFIWPFNGREPNDIESRAPGYLAIFQDIAQNARFPDGSMKGNSYEVIGDKMGGDADDYMLETFGIPSITSEMGFFGQFIKDWRCQSKSVCYEILRENAQWIEYIFTNVGRFAQHVVPK